MVNLRRKLSLYLLTLILSIFILSPLSVNAEGVRVFDGAGLLSGDEISQLEDEAQRIGDAHKMDIVILTTDDAEGKTSRAYADDFFDENGFGAGEAGNGIIFLIDMDNREAYISTAGDGIKYLTDSRIDTLLDRVINRGLGDEDFFAGSQEFLKGTEQYLEKGIPSGQFSEDENAKGENKITLMDTIISLIAGSAGGSAFYLRTKSKYKMKKPVKPSTFRNNSIVSLAANQNKLVDTVVTHRLIPKIQKDNSSDGKSTTHTSSSGKTHGGGGKKF